MKTLTLISALLMTISVFAGISIKKLADLPAQIKETSGLEFYKGKLITHNDSGDEARLYIINEKGEIERTIDVSDARNLDWEDISSADDGRFFIGDIGNNNNNRKQCQIYVLDKDFLSKKANDVRAKVITFSYEDQKEFPPGEKELNYDAEAMFWMNDSIYILTKCRTDPFTGRSYVYALPDQPGNYRAKRIGEIPFCSTGWMFCSVTAADYDSQSKTLAVLLYGKFVLIRDIPGNRFWDGKITVYNIASVKQREAVTFIDNTNWYMSDEKSKLLGGGNLYHISKK